MKREIFGFDAFSPSEIAERVEAVGVTKARLPLLSMAMLGVLAIVFPVSAFVAAGFEHSIANMYIIPLAMMLRDGVAAPVSGAELIDWVGFARNLAPVILGNLVGGSVLVALVYHVIYRRGSGGQA